MQNSPQFRKLSVREVHHLALELAIRRWAHGEYSDIALKGVVAAFRSLYGECTCTHIAEVALSVAPEEDLGPQ